MTKSKTFIAQIKEIISLAAVEAYPELKDSEVQIKRTENPKFGHFQTEIALRSAKILRKRPSEIAESIKEKISSAMFNKIEVVNPGFINIFLSDNAIAEQGLILAKDPLVFCKDRLSEEKIIIDYSGPNVAKTMHIGHFRATIVGNAIYRLLNFLGADIESDNHIGDWGTQFGKLITAYNKWLDKDAYKKAPIAELERLYQYFEKVKDDQLENEARAELVKLQKGDVANKALWTEFINFSMSEFNVIYDRLDISFDHTLGESFYNDSLAGIAEGLLKKEIAKEENGAVIIDTEDRYKVAGPVIVRKSDGGFGYVTSDLATVEYRIKEFNPSRIIYVTDSRQQDHFRAIFAASNEYFEIKENLSMSHVWFGSIKDKDGESFSTRKGNVVILRELINEAVTRARKVVDKKNSDLPEEEKQNIAEVVGVSALKYAELNHDLKTDTLFDWERMLSFEGNTAPYHLYTCARIKSIFRKYTDKFSELPNNKNIVIENENVKRIILLADSFEQRLFNASKDLKPNYVSEFINDLSSEINSFYNKQECPVLNEENKELRESRITVYKLSVDLLASALSILGIPTLERM